MMASYGSAAYGVSTYGDVLSRTTHPGRAVRYLPALFTATRDNQILEDISDRMVRGEVTLDLDREVVKMTFTGEMRKKFEVRGFETFVAPYLRLIYEDGTEDWEQVGLFLLLPSIAHHYPAASMYELQGVDLAFLLEANQTPVTVNDGINSTPVHRVWEALNSVGFSRLSIPPGGSVYTKAVSWSPGTTRLRRINDRLLTAGYYGLWFDRHGIPTSRPYSDLAAMQPSVRYTSAAGSRIVPPIDDEPDWSRVCNRVVVVGTDPAGEPIVAVRENNDLTSPVSYQNLGNQWISPQDTDVPQVQDQAAADALAEERLRNGASYLRHLTLQTLPDPTRNPREVYELDVHNIDGLVADGKWWCSGWTLPLDPENPVMTHNLHRTESIQMSTPA